MAGTGEITPDPWHQARSIANGRLRHRIAGGVSASAALYYGQRYESSDSPDRDSANVWKGEGATRPATVAVTTPAGEPRFELSKSDLAKGCLSPYFIADAAAKVAPAVVNITLHQERANEQFPDWFGRFQDRSSGSGVVFDEDGLILTNYHVVSEAILTERTPRRCTLIVSLQDGRVYDGKVINFDKTSDLALLRVDSEEKLPAAKLGTSKTLRVGEFVIALGSPLHLRNSVTAGIISCTDRKSKELGLTGSNGVDYIQTDAAINHGNSGGPLINIHGEVIGINNMSVLAADGVSFAIPVDIAKQVITQLTLQGRVNRPYLGIKMLQLNPYIAGQLMKTSPQFPDVENGILVPEVARGSPAERAGFQPGDVIVGFQGSKGELTTSALIEELSRHIGTSLELQVARRSVHGKQHLIRLHVIATRAE